MIMSKKYKCIKIYPDSPVLGTIVNYDESDDVYWAKFKAYSTNLEIFSEFWAEYIFTTIDGVDMFKGDEGWYIRGDVQGIFTTLEKPKETTLYFSTKEKAKEYLESLRNLNFELGVWYEHESGIIALYSDKKCTIGFLNNGIYVEEWSQFKRGFKFGKWKKANLEEVKELLLKEAKRRYPKGTKFQTLMDRKEISTGKFYMSDYSSHCHYVYNGVLGNAQGIVFDMRKGKWAEIIEEKKYYGVMLDTYTSFYTITKLVESNRPFKLFESEKERDEYIRLNKPKYSLQDIKNLFEIE